MDVKGSDLGFGLEKVPQGIVDLLILFALILLSILLFVPKTQSQNAIGVGVRDEHNLVDEAALLFRIGTAFSSMMLASSCDFPDLLVISTTRVNMCAPFVG